MATENSRDGKTRHLPGIPVAVVTIRVQILPLLVDMFLGTIHDDDIGIGARPKHTLGAVETEELGRGAAVRSTNRVMESWRALTPSDQKTASRVSTLLVPPVTLSTVAPEIFAAKGMVKSSLATVWRRRSAHAAHSTSRCSWVLLGG